MFDSVIKKFTGGDAGNVAEGELHSGLDSLLGNATSDHTSGAIGESLQALGPDGFAQSVQSSAQNQGSDERGQVGSMLLRAVEQGGGSPGDVLSKLGIGAKDPQAMGHNELGALAGYVAGNHGDALANVLGGGAGGGNSMEAGAMHLLGNPMVQQTAMNLAKRLL